MTCPACGKPLDANATACPACGARVTGLSRRLVRAPGAGRIAGICAGIAAYFDVDVVLIRIVWVVLSIFPGGIIGGVLAYVVAWAIMPLPDGADPPVRAAVRRSTDRQIAGVCGGLAAYLGVDPTVVRVAWAVLTVVPGAIVFGVVAYLVAWMVMPDAAPFSPAVPHAQPPLA
jgi:phage shock protein PspC (stress-responsive transcriptional regulator)